MINNEKHDDNSITASLIKKKCLNIKEAAGILGISKSTLRDWDIRGKFTAKRHPINNYRVYVLADLIKLSETING